MFHSHEHGEHEHGHEHLNVDVPFDDYVENFSVRIDSTWQKNDRKMSEKMTEKCQLKLYSSEINSIGCKNVWFVTVPVDSVNFGDKIYTDTVVP